MTNLDDLNPQQREAVSAGLGQTLVLAGPGSGKTRVLTRRIAYLIQSMAVRPYRILAVTFTNKAAKEMMMRLEHLLGDHSDGLWLGTFHAACARILRREADYLPYESNFVIMDADDQLSIVKRTLKELNLDDKQHRPGSIHAAISHAKNELILPDDYPASNYRDEVIVKVYKRYQEVLETNNAVDFDDLLLWCVRLLADHPSVREQYGRRFEHVLVDEFQDTNLAQYELLKLISAYNQNLFVVGDEDQSIYRWRGADYRNILRFEDDFPNAKKILLEENYRSTQTVLDAARAVISHNTNRTPKHLSSARQVQGARIISYEAADDHAEAAYVVDTIRRETDIGGKTGKEYAIMYRTNAQSRLLEEAFMRVGIPYRLVGAQRFYGRREIKDLISFLRLAYNPTDEISLSRIINVPPRGIGAKTQTTLQLCARQANCSPGEVLLDLGIKGEASPYWDSFSKRGVSMLTDFGATLAGWRKLVEDINLPALFDQILEDTGYQAHTEDNKKDRDAGIDRWENVQELRRMAYEYQEQGIVPFLENLALVSDQDTLPDKYDAPTLLTLHAAKGLEFDAVFIIGMDDGLLPHSRSFYDPEEMAEERRLFYVGVTRSKNRLFLVRAGRRSSYGVYEDSLPSRFLDDIPKDLLISSGVRSYRKQTDKWEDKQRWESPPTRTVPTTQYLPPPIPQRYKAGHRVQHSTWGEGIVVDSRMQDSEETVTVVFESVGVKRLLASVAKLEILNG
jgi:DNA helicase II / ATP-dependent DNA helicase PcrA